ncbi:transglutaminase-like cysteine peptidase [Yoonia sp.]|uniref:transglutaminase-like cysteine peptidase n=1 Tax=Yoonia sp. TaxID=2212373 RepID=UPI0019F94B5D|nr:transglutaminase-like cysteine peptidase [Yoonia sp.]MBE0414820.1 transglutaminase-like cysteine peptidase [Yoonia sp.]
MMHMTVAEPQIAVGLRPVVSACQTGRKFAQNWIQQVKVLALCGMTSTGLFLSTTAAQASEGVFLASRMTVAAPAGATDLCTTYRWACARADVAVQISAEQLAFAAVLNRQINRDVRSISDQTQYRRPEHWALPTSRGGDCEDFALLKKKKLIEAGVNPQNLLVATVLDRDRNAHAVLVIRTPQGDYVLDNLHNRILHWQSTGYTFLRMQNPDNPVEWTAVLAGGIIKNDNAVATAR